MKPFKGDMQLAIGIIVVAAIYLFMDMRLPEIRLSDPLGPRAFPALVGVGLIASAFLLMLERRHKIQAQTEFDNFAKRQAAGASAAASIPTGSPTGTQAEASATTPVVVRAAALFAEAGGNSNAVAATPGTATPQMPDVMPAQQAALAAPEASNAKAKHPLLTLAGMVAWTALYDFCFTPLGYLLATILFLLGLLTYFNRGRHKTNLSVAIGFTIVFDFLFTHLLGVPMPAGLLSI